MNKKTLQKVLDELKKDAPDISYVRGILETLLDTDEPVSLPIAPNVVPVWPGTPSGPFPNPITNPPFIVTNETKTDTREPSVSEAGMMGKVDLSAIQTG